MPLALYTVHLEGSFEPYSAEMRAAAKSAVLAAFSEPLRYVVEFRGEQAHVHVLAAYRDAPVGWDRRGAIPEDELFKLIRYFCAPKNAAVKRKNHRRNIPMEARRAAAEIDLAARLPSGRLPKMGGWLNAAPLLRVHREREAAAQRSRLAALTSRNARRRAQGRREQLAAIRERLATNRPRPFTPARLFVTVERPAPRLSRAAPCSTGPP